jgi:ADP-ribose pyrophosphatase
MISRNGCAHAVSPGDPAATLANVSDAPVPAAQRTTRHGERTIYDSEWIRLGLADIETPDGRRFDHHVVHMKPVAIAVLLDRSIPAVLMLRRHRWVTDECGFELLGGLVEPGEEPAVTAAREAEEESGWRPIGPPRRLAAFQPLPGMVDAATDMFLWDRFEHVSEPTDAEEAGELRWVRLDAIPQLITQRQVLGAGTLIALLQLVALEQGVDTTQAAG